MDTCKLQEENLDASVDAGDRCENTQHGGTGELLGLVEAGGVGHDDLV